MPQLNPTPWLFILTLTWLALMITFLNKTLFTAFPNLPIEKEQQTKTHPWTWPWS